MSKKIEKASFQGERGAFSEIAAAQLLPGAEVVPCARFEDVFKRLADGEATAAVVPIENTLHGSVYENYDHLLNHDLPIVAETRVRIVHNLIAAPGVRYKDVKKIYSHPVALNQCLKFFAANPAFEREIFYDTAGSVKMVMERGLRDAAAIASAAAAGIYGARILRRSIEDDRENFTRFFLLRRPEVAARAARKPRDGRVKWKTSLVFTTRDVPGTLFRSLSALALRDLSLTKIESRPLRGKPWEYLFYVDFLGHMDDPAPRNAINHLRETSDFLRILGCYPECGRV